MDPDLRVAAITAIDWVLTQHLTFDEGPIRTLTDIIAGRLMRRRKIIRPEIWAIQRTTLFRRCKALWPAIQEQCVAALRANMQPRLEAQSASV